MKWYVQEIVNSVDALDEMINEIEQIQEDLLEDSGDYRALEESREHLIKAKKLLDSLL